MAEPIERAVFSGLNTDATPERIADQAFNLNNIVPVSPTNVRPRQGTTEVAAYQPSMIGRVDIVDGAPSDLENAILIVCQNNYYSNGGALINEIEKVFRFRPSRTADLYANVEGIQLATSLFATFNGVPYALDFIFQVLTVFAPTPGSTVYPLGAVFQSPGTYDEAGYSDTIYTFARGLFIYAYLSNPLSNKRARTNVYDIETALQTADGHLEFSEDESWISSAMAGIAQLYGGATPLPSNYLGYMIWYAKSDQTNLNVWVMRNAKWDSGSLNSAVGTLQYEILIAGPGVSITDSGLICDLCPISKSRDIMMLVGKGLTTGGQNQAVLIKESIGLPVDGKSAAPYSTPAYHEYVAANWTGWTDRPNTCLDIQQIPLIAKRVGGGVVVLLGNWVASPTINKAITNPRLARVAGPAQSVPGDQAIVAQSVSPLGVLNSHANGTTYRAHGMVVDQFGYIYAVGTGDFVAGAATYLIVKYASWDFTVPIARVAHLSNGLGSGYADPLNTHICDLMIDGAYLIVKDVDASKTRLFVYDLNLNYITQITVGAGATLQLTANWANSVANDPYIPPILVWETAQYTASAHGVVTVVGTTATDQLWLRNFGFVIPSDATINGVTVVISRKRTTVTSAVDVVVKLTFNNTAPGSNKASGAAWPTSYGDATYGGAADVWGCSLTPAIVNSTSFGVIISASISAAAPGTVDVQYAKIVINYTTAITGPVVCNKYSTRFFADNY